MWREQGPEFRIVGSMTHRDLVQWAWRRWNQGMDSEVVLPRGEPGLGVPPKTHHLPYNLPTSIDFNSNVIAGDGL